MSEDWSGWHPTRFMGYLALNETRPILASVELMAGEWHWGVWRGDKLAGGIAPTPDAARADCLEKARSILRTS